MLHVVKFLLLFLRTLLKKRVAYNDEIFKIALQLFWTWPSILNASCHHPERISCRLNEIWNVQSVVSLPPVVNVSAPFYHKLSLALNYLLLPLSHALEQHSVTQTKDFLSCSRPLPDQVQPVPALQMRVPATHVG